MRTNLRGRTAAALAWVFALAAPLHAQMDMQHDMHMPEGPLGIPETRMGSGTSWLPDASPMHAAHLGSARGRSCCTVAPWCNTTTKPAYAAKPE